VRIILNADDFGFNDDAVRATIECLERGALTGATIMTTTAESEQALAYARAHPEYSWGVHLTLSSDGPEGSVLGPERIPALLDGDGKLWNGREVRRKAIWRQLPSDQIAAEMIAQIARVQDAGVTISHLDSHGHLHKFKVFRDGLEIAARHFGITRVRSAQDMYVGIPWKTPTYWIGFVWRAAIRRRFRTTDHFYMPTGTREASWVDAILARLKPESDATIEVGVHPGYSGWQADERKAVIEFADKARAAGHRIVGWKDV
jgi:predicted glycoside hydrolase/deacetylase ChbG (UPF0249 family)